MSDVSLNPPVGASVGERELFIHLTDHIKHEGALLDEYAQACDETESKALAYVIGLLLEDERRHHRQFFELAETLKSEAELQSTDPVVPRLDMHRVDRDKVLTVTRRLLAMEEADAAELKRLRKELRDVEDTTLWALLVENMQSDTAKHIAMLKFVERHTSPRRS
jgi:rubrerythrin